MYGIEDKILAISFSLIIALLAAGVRRFAGTFFIPAGIFALSWFAFTIFPLVILFEVPINSLSILYILLAVLAFCTSALPFNWKFAIRKNLLKSMSAARFDSQFLKLSLYFSMISSIALSILTMTINGFTINQVVFNLLQTSGQYAATRGTDGVEYGIIGVLGLMFTYLCPVLGGLRSFAAKRKWFFAVSMVPSLFTMVIQSSKLVFLISLFFYLSGAIVARIYAGQLRLPNISGLPKVIAGSAIFIPLILVSFVSRLGEFDPSNISSIIEPLLFSLYSYTLGQVYAFADFFAYTIGSSSNSPFEDEYYSMGAYTFASIFDMLGIGKEFPPGMYNESGAHLEVFRTNIFTFFRGLIYDFGVVGSIIFIFIFGLFCHFITYYVLIRTRAWFLISIFIAILVFIFMGYLFSVFVARYMFLNAAVVWALLSLNALQRQKTHPTPNH